MSENISDELLNDLSVSSNTGEAFEDVAIICIDCSNEFIWTAGERSFYRDKNLQNPPKRCKECKQAKNRRIAALTDPNNADNKPRIEVQVNCANCNTSTTVPFYPSQGRPVFCRSCFLAMNPSLIPGNV